jgi:hypothetical protein
MARGGARPGAGRPVGTTNDPARAVTKEALREVLRQKVAAQFGPLIDAQLSNALGRKYLVTRDRKNGKFLRVGEAMARNSDEETIEVWEADPSIQAFTDLMNRALDKAKEQEQEIKVTGEVALVARLQAARKRIASSSVDSPQVTSVPHPKQLQAASVDQPSTKPAEAEIVLPGAPGAVELPEQEQSRDPREQSRDQEQSRDTRDPQPAPTPAQPEERRMLPIQEFQAADKQRQALQRAIRQVTQGPTLSNQAKRTLARLRADERARTASDQSTK